MSTHHLAHSIAEGGQGAARTNLRKRSIRRERTRANSLIAQGDWDADFRLEKRWRRKRAYHDPSIVERWLQSQLGREWDAVYSELCIRYPKRQSRNLWIFEWIKQNVALHPNVQLFWPRFIVDWDGKLCCRSEFVRTRTIPRKPDPVPKPESWPNTLDHTSSWPWWARPKYPLACIGNIHYWMQPSYTWRGERVFDEQLGRRTIRVTRTWHILRPLTAQELHYLTDQGVKQFAQWDVRVRIQERIQWQRDYYAKEGIDKPVVPILVSPTLPPQD